MKRTMASAAVIAVSLGVLLGGAGTAVAQGELYGKYPNLGTCQAEGAELVRDHIAGRYHCEEHRSSPASQRWWMYIV